MVILIALVYLTTVYKCKFSFNKLSQEQIEKCISEVHEEAKNLIGGCYIQFQDSAANACARGRQSQSAAQISNCENYGTHTPINAYIQRDPTPTCRWTPYGCFSN